MRSSCPCSLGSARDTRPFRILGMSLRPAPASQATPWWPGHAADKCVNLVGAVRVSSGIKQGAKVRAPEEEGATGEEEAPSGRSSLLASLTERCWAGGDVTAIAGVGRGIAMASCVRGPLAQRRPVGAGQWHSVWGVLISRALGTPTLTGASVEPARCSAESQLPSHWGHPPL